jgi:murein DD-endopeptidase MepM/ murein hydrolase activator NlpD
MLSKSTINMPVPKDHLKHIDRTSSPAHVGQLRSAIDLVADEDTPVLAAADGIVTFFKDSSNSGGG